VLELDATSLRPFRRRLLLGDLEGSFRSERDVLLYAFDRDDAVTESVSGSIVLSVEESTYLVSTSVADRTIQFKV